MQERIKILDYPLEFRLYPEWVNLIDSGQIGYNLKGVLKAYDFAEDVNKLTINKVTKKNKM